MKKVVIGAAIVAVLGVGGYLLKDKIGEQAGNVAETQLTEYVNSNLNKPIAIDELNQIPNISDATFTFKSKTENVINSELSLNVDGKAIVIPLKSDIVRGKTQYKQVDYGFGKIVTKPDLSSVNDLPKFVTNDTFSETSYIALNGDMMSVIQIAPIQHTEDGDTVDLKGVDIAVASTILDQDKISGMTADFKGLTASSEKGESLEMKPFNYSVDIDDSGKYTGSSSPINLTFNDTNNPDENVVVDLSKGAYSGIYKKIESLEMPMNNGEAVFDNLTINAGGLNLVMKNVKAAGGLYEVDANNSDLKASLSTDIDANSLPDTLPDGTPLPVKPSSFSLSYGLKNIPHDVLNTYQQGMSSFEPMNSDSPFTEEQGTQMLQGLQKNASTFDLAINLDSDKGKADAAATLGFSAAGQTADTNALMSAIEAGPQSLKYFEGNVSVDVAKSLADAAQLTGLAQMMGIQPEGDKIIIKAELKDGKATMNGNPLPL